MRPDLVDIVLVRPSRPANVAAACRAMKNMGLRTLRLVDGPSGLDRPEARGVAYGAWDVLEAATSWSTLQEAVADAALVVGTSGRPAAEAWTPRRLAEEGPSRAGAGRVAIVFGPESAGLRNEELALCHLRVHIPTDATHLSLNLAQAVLIVAYEIHLSAQAPREGPMEARATAGQIEAALLALERGLLAIGYLNPQNPASILSEIRGLLARAGPTPREANLIQGMARQIAWAGDRIARSRKEDR